MTNPVRFGVYAFPQTAPFSDSLAAAQRAEAAGLDSVWVADETPMAYPGQIHFDAWSLLGALARETSRVTLGTLVTPALFRHPLMNAMAASTVDHASAGRVVVGFGAGGVPEDLAGIGHPGVDGSELVARLDEQVNIVDRLLRGEIVSKDDGFYRMRDARIEPPLQKPRPRIVIAAAGRRALEIAARRADTWNCLGGQPIAGETITPEAALAQTRRQIELLDAASVKLGRDPATIERSILYFRAGAYGSYQSLVDWVGRYFEIGFREYVLFWPGRREADALLDRLIADLVPVMQATGRMP